MNGNRYLQFSIKTLLAMTAIVALGLGGWSWWAERSRLQRENWRLIRENAELKAQYSAEHNAVLAASSQSRGWQELHAEIASEAARLKRIVDEAERIRRNAALPNSSAPASDSPKE